MTRLGRLLWLWVLVLVIINIIPIGNDANRSLSGNKIFAFRLDYLVHLIMILVFAWIELAMKVLKFSGFGVLKFAGIVFTSAIGLELIQALIPWRSFNPIDMLYNVLGAILGSVFVYYESNC